MSVQDLKKELRKSRNAEQAVNLSRFFKTKKGEYGEGDIFWGIKVPQTRAIAKKYGDFQLEDIQILLSDEVHEVRFAGLMVLLEKYRKTKEEKEKKIIFDFYLKNIKNNINNWDLVDLSCPQIIGNYLFDKDKDILYKLSKSNNLWERRVSIISTFYFIKNNQFEDALNISKDLLGDGHDLIHKAVGWMLREVGKRNLGIERKFLNEYYKSMPRTCLRYAIEKMEEKERKSFLEK